MSSKNKDEEIERLRQQVQLLQAQIPQSAKKAKGRIMSPYAQHVQIEHGKRPQMMPEVRIFVTLTPFSFLIVTLSLTILMLYTFAYPSLLSPFYSSLNLTPICI